MAGKWGPAASVLYGGLAPSRMDEESNLLIKTKTRSRKLLNIRSVVTVLFAPWLLFSFIVWLLSFDLYRHHKGFCYVFLALSLLLLLLFTFFSVASRRRAHRAGVPQEASWILVLYVCLGIAWILGILVGLRNYHTNLKQAYDFAELNMYSEIDPARVRGEQMMDAGTVRFSDNTFIDLGKSMAFKSKVLYCVAPISTGNATLATYDFWAVGTDCCNGYQASFTCGGPHAASGRGAIRRLSDQGRDEFRLAVEQAASAYGIRAVHPLFFTWVGDVVAEEQSWKQAGRFFFLMAISTAFVVQAFLVTVLSFGFAKLG